MVRYLFRVVPKQFVVLNVLYKNVNLEILTFKNLHVLEKFVVRHLQKPWRAVYILIFVFLSRYFSL